MDTNSRNNITVKVTVDSRSKENNHTL